MLIIGAGPTGLGCAYRLKELGHERVTVLEAHPYAGGLAHSFKDDAGFTWDIGGHVMFSHYSYYDEVFEKMMGEDFTLNNREAWVRIAERWVPYPFQNNIRYLPAQMRYECLRGLVRAQVGGEHGSPADAANFGEFIDAVFGEGIAAHFMRPYNFKVWAHPPEHMNKAWIGERVAVLDVDRALKNVVLEQDDFGWGPNNRFKFPLFGGTGEFYDRIARSLGDTIRCNTRVASVDPVAKVVTLEDGEELPYDVLVSAMPVDILCKDIVRGVPDEIVASAAGLAHSGGHMVGVGVKRAGGTPSTKSWMYFPEDNCPFYRATYLSNYSPNMTPDKDEYFSILCETSYSGHKPEDAERIVDQTIQGLVNVGMLDEDDQRNIVTRWHYHAEYSYPVPTVDRDERLSVVIPWLEDRGIYSRGRFGMWKYEVSNTDHTLMQGVELADRLMLGQPETTIGMVYRVTEDGREAAEHERSRFAGSGEKRVMAGKPAKVGDVSEADISEEELALTSNDPQSASRG